VSSDAWQAPEFGNARIDEERSVDVGPEAAEEFAEDVGVDPTPQDVEHYVELQEQVEPPD
jgi:hypothetical protein